MSVTSLRIRDELALRKVRRAAHEAMRQRKTGAKWDRCAGCGKSVERRAGSGETIVCQDCRRAKRITCHVCGKPMSKSKAPQGEAAHYKCVREYRCKIERCGAEIDSNWRKRGGKLVCRDHFRNVNHIERAVRYGAPWENVDIDVVYAESEWRCGLCELPVDALLRYPHKLSPTLDHIVPLSRGPNSPGHVASNCQLAHACCNNLKQATAGVDVAVAQGLVLSIDPADGYKTKPRRICPECDEPIMGRQYAFHAACLKGRRARLARERDIQHAREIGERREQRESRGRRAAELRASGMAWQAISDELGFSGTGAAYNAATNFMPVTLVGWLKRKPIEQRSVREIQSELRSSA